MPFTTVASLVTSLLNDIRSTYVIDESSRDRHMRRRIAKSIEIINGYQEISNLIIKGDPFHEKKHHPSNSNNLADKVRAEKVVPINEMEDSDMTSSSVESSDDG